MTNRNHQSTPNTSFLSFARGGGLFRLVFLAVPALASAENWPQWRGPRSDGTCLEKSVPVEWNVQRNCAWKTELPGDAHSSPIISGDRLFTATAQREKG
jgi:outer membrane protein assembly factor BamB